mgnify:CR=1 FL=1
MVADEESPAGGRVLSPDVADAIAGLDGPQLRSLVDYARRRMRSVPSSVTERIEAGAGEEIVRLEARDGYTEVVKRQPCADGCDRCPHGPFLYHVVEERHVDGSTHLHWTFLGRTRE